MVWAPRVHKCGVDRLSFVNNRTRSPKPQSYVLMWGISLILFCRWIYSPTAKQSHTRSNHHLPSQFNFRRLLKKIFFLHTLHERAAGNASIIHSGVSRSPVSEGSTIAPAPLRSATSSPSTRILQKNNCCSKAASWASFPFERLLCRPSRSAFLPVVREIGIWHVAYTKLLHNSVTRH